jgi:hypothetical protein
MARDPRLTALRRPTSIPVHDDGDVTRQAIPVNGGQQTLIGTAWGYDFCEISKHCFYY